MTTPIRPDQADPAFRQQLAELRRGAGGRAALGAPTGQDGSGRLAAVTRTGNPGVARALLGQQRAASFEQALASARAGRAPLSPESNRLPLPLGEGWGEGLPANVRAALGLPPSVDGAAATPAGLPPAIQARLAARTGLTAAPGQTGTNLTPALSQRQIAGQAPAAAMRQTGTIPRVFQRDPSQYDTDAQVRTWGPSTCSAASLTAVLRSRGLPVRIVDVMRAMPHALTPELGLVNRPALAKAAEAFGVGARDDVTSYDGLRQATAAGQPVLVDVTNGKFPEGHWLVVTAADADGLRVVDSSGYNLTSLSRQEFLQSWSGKGIRILDGAATAAQGQRVG